MRDRQAFAERVRERVDPDLVIDLAMRVAGDEKLAPEQRLAALWPLIDRGFVKPPTTFDATVTNGNAPTYDVSGLSPDELRERLEWLRAKRITSADGRPMDDDSAASTIPVESQHEAQRDDALPKRTP